MTGRSPADARTMLADLVETGAALYAAAFIDEPSLVWILNVASYVRQLPETDPRFARLVAIPSDDQHRTFPLPGDAVLAPFAAGEPHPTTEDYDQLVELLIAAAERLSATKPSPGGPAAPGGSRRPPGVWLPTPRCRLACCLSPFPR